jgi:beta-fructofuranosidase
METSRRNILLGALASGTSFYFFNIHRLDRVLASVTPRNIASDPRRPQFHMLPAANWMNDPNGPIYWNGKYHMFYQYNPDGAFWGNMHWGHAISPDMIHWTHLQIALSPTPGGPDADGCFTGTAVVHNGAAIVLYTGVVSVLENKATSRNGIHSLRESQCLATSMDPELRTWSKLAKPVISAPPQGMYVTGFRDPSPWNQGEWWYTAVGSGFPQRSGAVLLYRSKDLRHWEYLHVAASGDYRGTHSTNPIDSGDMWECPDLFPLGGKHVLIYSAKGKVHWQLGELNPETMLFHPENEGILDFGSFYAGKTQLDDEGNRILWGWIPETRPEKEYRAAGWAGMMSLPRVLTLGSDGLPAVQVAPVVHILRRSHQVLKVSASEEQNKERIQQMSIENCCGEILCSFKKGGGPFALSLYGMELGSTTQQQWLEIHYDPEAHHQIMIDGQVIPVDLRTRNGLEVHMYIDGSVVELFLNKQIAFTKRVYYSGEQAPTMHLSLLGKTTSLSRCSMWQLTPISANRLTT